MPMMPMMPMVPKLPTDIEPPKSDFVQRFILPERFRLAEGGDVSVKDAEKMAPQGEFLAYINDDEAALLKSLGGAGKAVNETGIPSFFVKKLFKKAKKAVKKVVKSDLGKAALTAAAIYGLGGGTFMGRTLPTFGSLPLQSSAAGPGGFGFGNILTNVGRLTGLGSGGLDLGTKFSGLSKGKKALAGIAGASLLGGLAAGAGGEDDESLDDVVGRISDQTGIDVQQIRKEVQDAYAKGDLSSLASKYPFLVPKGSAMAKGGRVEGIKSLKAGAPSIKVEGDVRPENMKMAAGPGRKKLLQIYNDSEIAGELGPGNSYTTDELEEILFKLHGDMIYKAEGGIARLGYQEGGDIQKQAEEAMKEGFPRYTDKDGNEVSLEKFLKAAAEEDKKMVMPKRKPPKEVQKRKEKNFKKAKPALEKESADMVEDLIRSKKAGGGLMNLGGMEMDLRGGGFVPIGAKEKADDVPARLSKNEFVFTADAVRAAGGGSVEKGAQKMYNTMKQLEDSIA